MRPEELITGSQPKQTGKRRKKPVMADRQEVVSMAIANPNLTHQEIATLHNIERSTVSKILTEANISKDDIVDYKNNEADLLTALRLRIYRSVTDADIKEASFLQRMTALGIAYDKYRLETNQSTENQAVLVSAIHDLKSRKRLRNGEEVAVINREEGETGDCAL